MDLRNTTKLLSVSAKLLPAVITYVQALSIFPSSRAVYQYHQIEAELKKLMRTLERITAMLYDAEQRAITDLSVKLWLKELERVAYDANDVLIRTEDSCKIKLIQDPYGMLDQIQQIRSTFDKIVNDGIALQLSKGKGEISQFVVELDIFGRESEKEKLIELLSTESNGVSVVTIVGMGGIGKTTLAQLAYKDQTIRQSFDKFGWICVSEDFNVERLTKESVESITGDNCGLTNLSALQEKIQNEISGKRVILVLDDVWNENKSLWDLFQTPFMSAAFVKILVTTRNNRVAEIMQTEPTFNLGYLSYEESWQLFEHYTFGGVEQKKGPKLVEIGRQIMNKCGLLPLAVKSIAGLLRLEEKEESWRDILENELWESTEVSNEISPSLQISYARLPTYLKSSFIYCSMFPKDYSYDVEELVKLWIFQGFIVSKDNKTAEKIGFEYAQQLCQRSLFENSDIVHDLAVINSQNSELWELSAGNEIFPSTETMCTTSPNKKVKRRIKSWSRGKQLGGGSFGTVYEAISDEGFFFAVKEVLISHGTNAQQCIAQLEHEIALLSQLEHENIVQYYGTDMETKLCIFLELMTQGSIASLYQNYHLQDTLVSKYTRQILYGLVYLHEKNIVHRDIKCANILIDANGSVKLADFGLAKKMTTNNIVNSSNGSVYWMAPEVVNPKKTYGLKADIWSLGCTVLEMLTRQIPYPNMEWTHAFWKIGRGEQPPIPNHLSIEAQDFITQCIRVNPDQRPSAVQLLEHPFVNKPLPLRCSPPASQS